MKKEHNFYWQHSTEYPGYEFAYVFSVKIYRCSGYYTFKPDSLIKFERFETIYKFLTV